MLNPTSTSCPLQCEDYSSLRKLLRVTAYVLKFVALLKKIPEAGPQPYGSLTITDLETALTYWLKLSQSSIPLTNNFEHLKHQFDLFQDDKGLLRCGGRLGNAKLPRSALNPVLLDKSHHLSTLIVRDCHERTMHGGEKTTLTELRSKYWIVRGRQFVRRILHQCVRCRRQHGKPYQPPPPQFWVRESQPVSSTGVDFAGPLYIRGTTLSSSRKVWICLYTCCVTRAVHLELVPDMTAQAFIRSLKRLASRRGFPSRIVSDNAKTFKAAEKMIATVLESPEALRYYSDVKMKWNFNLERAPWWGGLFKRMVQSMKRCLRKTIGSARLTYDELTTALTEVEGILNSNTFTFADWLPHSQSA